MTAPSVTSVPPAAATATPAERRALGASAGAGVCARWLSGRRALLLDALLLVVVLGVASAMRLRFLSAGVPVFVTPDSDDYLWPGYALAYGLGFEPELRRTPLYPIFIGGVLLFGGNLATLAAVQHALGVVTAGLTYLLGRAAVGPGGGNQAGESVAWPLAGRLVGLAAGLLVALSGPLIIYEHFMMSEGLFTLVLTLALLLLVMALRQPTVGWLVVAGVGVGLACLTRPIGQVAAPVALGLPFLLALPSWRDGLRRALLVVVGILLVMAPWSLRNLAIHGTPGAEGALGQALIGRTVRHDKGYLYDDPAHPDPNPTRAAARRIIQEEANGGEPSGGTITQRVRDELGLTQAQTSTLLRDLALSEIWERPGHYLQTTREMAWELFQGRNERLLGNWRQRTTRNWDRKWDPRIVALLDPDRPAEGDLYERADGVTSFFQPWRWRTSLSWLAGIGLVAALAVPRLRPALAPALTVILLVVAASALDGLVWRFRYPADPAIAVAASLGVGAPWALAWVGIARYRLLGGRRDTPGTPGGIIDDASASEGHSHGNTAERGAGGRRIDGVVPR
ncbi:MAG: glycosyltransferase family 39 protein [Chloroflexi bacterium]|nr:glycosyltransferase family 39 protein [Chloroflexota bacterium]